MINEGIIILLIELCVHQDISIQEVVMECICILLCEKECSDNFSGLINYTIIIISFYYLITYKINFVFFIIIILNHLKFIITI